MTYLFLSINLNFIPFNNFEKKKSLFRGFAAQAVLSHTKKSVNDL